MYTNILVPIDGSSTSLAALRHAIELAKICSARLTLLHIIDMAEYVGGYITPAVYESEVHPRAISLGKELLRSTRDTLVQDEADVDIVLLENPGSHVSDLIVGYASRCRASVIVMGTHGMSGTRRLFLGSNAERVVQLSNSPVMLVKPGSRKMTMTALPEMRVIPCNETEEAV